MSELRPKTVGKSPEKTTVETDKTMVEKVNRQMASNEDSLMAKIIGLGLILLGIVFIVLAVVVVVLSRRSAQIDDTLPTPEIRAEQFTNESEVDVVGTTDPDRQVVFYVDGNEVDATAEADSDGNFGTQVPLPDEEGEYEIQAVTTEGFPLRKRSRRSEPVSVVVDKTAPSTEAQFDYDPVSEGENFSMKGNVEPFAVLKLTDGETEYLTTADENGDFEVAGVQHSEGENEFKVTLTDRAGNQRELAQLISVRWAGEDGPVAGGGSVNGDGVTVGPELPEAAGELEAALDVLLGNKLMMFFGLIAAAVLFINSGAVMMKVSSKK